jgi:hypothetical protein
MCAVNDPPLGSKNQAARDLNFKTVLRAITAVKEAEIPNIVEQVYKTQGEAGSAFLVVVVVVGAETTNPHRQLTCS